MYYDGLKSDNDKGHYQNVLLHTSHAKSCEFTRYLSEWKPFWRNVDKNGTHISCPIHISHKLYCFRDNETERILRCLQATTEGMSLYKVSTLQISQMTQPINTK
jgi:hypothetical protein